ncbi:MAG: glycosyltransferase family 2 protein, partial [Defluviimonas denitrificans]
ENFLSIVRDGWEPGLSLAFSDHDDVWFPDRLSRGLRALAGVGADTPALYCSRTIITDAALRPLRLSPPRPRAPSFRNALAQNIAAGNTILANPAAARLLHQAASRRPKIVSHDWWAYQIVTGAGGTILHDDAPTVLYRQHAANQIGANDSARARMRRIGMILSGVYRRWNDVNLAALTSANDLLTAENRDLVERFTAIRSGTRGLRCMTALRKLRLYRQTRASTAALYAAALFNRL